MLLPQVWEVVNHYRITKKATFYRHITKMLELNLLKPVEVEKVKVVYFTQKAADLLGTSKTVSTSKIANTRTLNSSMIKSQYAIKFMLQRYNNLDDFLLGTGRRSNMFTSNTALFIALKEDYEYIWKNTANELNFNNELNYLQYTYASKIAQLNGNFKKLSSVVKPNITVENLSRRGLYITSIKPTAEGLNTQLTLLERDTKLVSSENFLLDMEVLEKWSYNFPCNKIKLQVVVKPNRINAVKLIVRKFQLKKKVPFVIEVVEMESVINTYFNTAAIFLELNDDNVCRRKERKTSTITKITGNPGMFEVLL